MKRAIIVVLVVSSLIFGCHAKTLTVDGTSSESVQNCLFEMYKGLSSEDKDELELAVSIVASDGEVLDSISFNTLFEMPRPRSNIHGMTADEILVKAKEIAIEFFAKEERTRQIEQLVREQKERVEEIATRFTDLAAAAVKAGVSRPPWEDQESLDIVESFDEKVRVVILEYSVGEIEDTDFLSRMDKIVEGFEKGIFPRIESAISKARTEAAANAKRERDRINAEATMRQEEKRRKLEELHRRIELDGILAAEKAERSRYANDRMAEKKYAYNMVTGRQLLLNPDGLYLDDQQSKALSDAATLMFETLEELARRFVNGEIAQTDFDALTEAAAKHYRITAAGILDSLEGAEGE